MRNAIKGLYCDAGPDRATSVGRLPILAEPKGQSIHSPKSEQIPSRLARGHAVPRAKPDLTQSIGILSYDLIFYDVRKREEGEGLLNK